MPLIPVRRRLLLQAFQLSDLFLAATAFYATKLLFARISGLREAGSAAAVSIPTGAELLHLQTSVRQVLLFLAFLLLWHASFVILHLYDSRRLSTRIAEFRDIVRATSVGTLGLLVVGALSSVEPVNGRFLGLFWLVATAMTIAVRFTLRMVLARVRVRGRNRRHILIVGLNERTVCLARQFTSRPELGYNLIGFVDDERSASPEFEWHPVASLQDFARFVTEEVVDEVLVGLPVKSRYTEAARIIEQCGEQGIIVRLLSDFFGPVPAAVRSDALEEEILVTVTPQRDDVVSRVVKRTLDVALSLLALVVLLPVFVFTALLIRMTSPGPVLFVQERVGLNKRTFRLYKFRTMSMDAEARQPELEHLNEVEGAAFKIRNDPRVTWLGRFLRRASIDELPQFLNVLKGDMSLVGPRPLPIRDFRRFDKDWQRRRFTVRPGLTCLWQVDDRERLSFDQWMELDMEYIDEWSLLLDLKILARTVPAVVRGSGAM